MQTLHAVKMHRFEQYSIASSTLTKSQPLTVGIPHHRLVATNMSVKIAGLEKTTGYFGATNYIYRGVRITQGSGRYASPYDFDVNHNDKRTRVLAWNLKEATNRINEILGAE